MDFHIRSSQQCYPIVRQARGALADKEFLVSNGKLLAEKTRHCVFRSGKAKGAYAYFCEGVALVDSLRIELITPYSSHRKTARKGLNYTALDDVDIAQEPEVVYASSFNKSNKRLIDRYVSGNRDRVAMKAACLLRDTVKVLGTSSIAPTSFAFFYDDLSHPKIGRYRTYNGSV